jgi:GH24 family phage-related lysozyme (muramidase)
MGSMRITQSVGIGGKNGVNDIKAVQISLNSLIHLIPPAKSLVVDGKLGFKPENSNTVKAIMLLQKKVVGLTRSDGRIDVNGKTHKKINEKLIAVKPKIPVSTSEALKAKLRKKLEQYEGRVEHMYLDTKGYVTVGVGHMMSSAEEAKKVAFVNAASGAAATKKEIEDEYTLIKSKPFGTAYPAKRFKSYTKLKLTDSTINEITNKHIASFEGELKLIYGATEFKAYPENAKLALFDMIFNLGMSKLKTGYPNFNKYIKANDYKNAALESNRRGVAAERNLYVKKLLGK